jgi:hypothetical protein
VIYDSQGKLWNEHNEIVAEGNCQVDNDHGSVTFRPIIDTPLLSREQGPLRLELEDGTELELTARVIRFRLNVPGVPPGAAYRLFFTPQQRLRSAGGDQ